MPNWVEGKLKIRGDKKNIKRFLKDTLVEIEYKDFKKFPEITNVKVREVDKEDFEIQRTSYKHRLKFTGERHYITDNIIHSFSCLESIIGKDILVVGFEAATIINPIHFEGASIEYDLDFKIYGFEQGGEFNQDIEVVNGKIVKDELIEFDDYVWECIDPTIGG